MPFREFIGGRYGSDMNASKVYLAKEVLAEIPDQVVHYMKWLGVVPKPPVPTAPAVNPSQPPPPYPTN